MLRPPFMGRRGVVAAEHPLASAVGAKVLEEGGNAADAAVAVGLALAVLQPHLGGLGGDFFALVREPSGKVACLNGSGWASSCLNPSELEKRGRRTPPLHGVLSSVLPGFVPALEELHSRYGTLPWRSLVEPSIHLARQGFPVAKGLADALAANLEVLKRARGFAELFMIEGRPLRMGELLVQPSLAATLEELAAGGRQGFWLGRAGRDLIRRYAEEGLWLSFDELLELRPEWAQPLSITHSEAKIYEMPPNSLGAATLLILRLLEEQGAREYPPRSFERVKALVGAARLAHAAALEGIADPRFSAFSLDDFLSQRRGCGPRRGALHAGDTTAFCLIDGQGMVLLGIQSLYHHFGSRVFLEEAGFFLNNRASCFGETGPNSLLPKKRPLHTLSAVLVERQDELLGFGISGGFLRPQQHALLLTNVLDYGMSPAEAVEHPRFLWDPERDIVLVEDGIEAGEGGELAIRRLPYPSRTGVAQAVFSSRGTQGAVCDVRGDGLPSGCVG